MVTTSASEATKYANALAPAAEGTSECLVDDEAWKDREQESVDGTVGETAPDDLEREVEAVRPGRFRLGEDVAHEGNSHDDPQQDAPPPVALDDDTYVDLVAAHVRAHETDHEGEIDPEIEVVLQLEHA